MTEARSDSRVPSVVRGIMFTAAMGLLVALAFWYMPTAIRRPWDFETYWFAATAWMRGLNPYDPDVLARFAFRPVGMPFLYPPVTLLLFAPLTAFSVTSADQIWLVLKVLMLVPLTLLWRRHFLPGASVVLLAGVAVFGFNAACVWDLRSGNVTIVEQLLLWSGFAAYAADRRRLFAACIVAASIFKLFPILFLGLLLLPSKSSKASWRLVAGSLAAFAVIALLPTWVGPEWTRDFWHRMPVERPTGVINPCALGIIDTLLGDRETPLGAPPYRALGLWISYGVLLIAVSVPALRRLWRERDPREWALAAAMLYALLVPRMMVYSYMLVIVPVLALLAPVAARLGGLTLVATFLVAQALLWPAFGWPPRHLLAENLAFLTLLTCWLIYLIGPRRDSLAATVETQPSITERAEHDPAR